MFSLRAKVLPNLIFQILIAIIATDAWVSTSADPEFIQVLFIASLAVTGWYASHYVSFPSFFHWFILSYLALFFAYPIIVPILGSDLGAQRQIVGGYAFLSIAGLHLFILAYEAVRLRQSVQVTSEVRVSVSFRTLSRTMWVLVFVNVLGVLMIMVDAEALSVSSIMGLMEIGRSARKLEAGSISLLGNYLILAGAAAYAIGPSYLHRRRGWILPLMALWLAAEVVVFVAFRARTGLIMHLFAVLVGHFYLRRIIQVVPEASPSRGRRTRRLSFAAAICLIIAIGLLLRSQRGRIGDFQEGLFPGGVMQTLRLAVAYESRVGGDFGYTPTVFRVLELVPERRDYLGGQSYYRLLLSPIPRWVWEDKPENTGLIVGEWLFPGTTVQSNPPGVMGDLYLNFGYIGILGFLLYGIVFAALDNRSSFRYQILVAVSFTSIFHFTRGAFTNPVLQMIVLYLVAAAIDRAWENRRSVVSHTPDELPT